MTAAVIGAGLLTVSDADPVSATGPTCGGLTATIVGDANDNIIDGTPGNDVIVSGAGDDVVRGFGGNDTICLEDGEDRASGGEGQDAIRGGDQDDVLIGRIGNDFLAGDAGVDVIRGGDGVDRVSYNLSPAAVVVNLTAGTGTGEGSDTIVAVENATGSAFDDTLIGTDGPNSLDGLRGDDLLVGRDGLDVLFGREDRDTLRGLGGADIYNGGSEGDTVDFRFAATAVTADLAAGTATGEGSDTLTDVEHLLGSSHDDVLLGSSVSNRITGFDGVDRIAGRGASDGLLGGDLGDIVTGGNGADVIAGGSGNDDLFGSAHNDQISGGPGNDDMNGGAQFDTCSGGSDLAFGGDSAIAWRTSSGFPDPFESQAFVLGPVVAGGSRRRSPRAPRPADLNEMNWSTGWTVRLRPVRRRSSRGRGVRRARGRVARRPVRRWPSRCRCPCRRTGSRPCP